MSWNVFDKKEWIIGVFVKFVFLFLYVIWVIVIGYCDYEYVFSRVGLVDEIL